MASGDASAAAVFLRLKNFIRVVLECAQTNVCKAAILTLLAKPTKSQTHSARHSRARGPGELRLIGGKWRGRKLRFPSEEGLRPTSDRIRETLFNWLAPTIVGANCADLFAGSGALGLEALSRGAQRCDFVDKSSPVISQISGHLATLQANDTGHCHRQAALDFLKGPSTPYDLVFVDPPFRQGMVQAVCEALDTGNWLAPGATVYIETASDEALPELPAHWSIHREKTSGGVTYRTLHTADA